MRYSVDIPFGEFRGIEFSVDLTKVDAAYIHDQINALSADVKNGVPFEAGRGELTIGWVALDLVKNDAGYLQIQEPDFVHFPIRTVNSLTKTFQHFKRQVQMSEKLGLSEKFNPPTILDACLVCSSYDIKDAFMMERFASEGPRDSGWYIGCTMPPHDHNDPANLRRISLYEACLHRPTLIDYMGLPTGIKVSLEGSNLREAIYENQWLKPTP